jgi:ornithine cyclodeaminase
VRPIRSVHAWNRSAAKLEALRRGVQDLGLAFTAAAGCREVAESADVLITVTPSQQPLIEAAWVRPGTHINAMGADTRGKQELDPLLVAGAAVFVDEAAQAVSIGECQQAFRSGLVTEASFRASIGEVIAGLREGRRSASEITLFDGTGVALQDLVVAELAVRMAAQRNVGTVVAY